MPRAFRKPAWCCAAGAAALALAVALGAPAAAQAPAAPTPAAEASPPRVLPIPLNEVAVQAADQRARIQVYTAKLAAMSEAHAFAATHSSLEHEIQIGGLEVEDTLSRDYSRNEIEELRAHWNTIDEDLEDPQQIIDDRIVAVEGYLAELLAADTRWQATISDLDRQAAPASVRDAAEQTLTAIREARASVEKYRDGLLARQTHIVALRSAVARVLLRIDAAEDEMFQLAFQRNRDPLWRSIRDFDRPALASLRLRLEHGQQAVARYLRHHVTALALQTIALLALFWLGWKARMAALRRRPETPPAELPLALRHPVAAAVLLSIAPIPWVYANAPLELTRIFGLVVLPAWFILLRAYLPRALHRTVMGLAVIVLFEVLREIIGTALAARQLVLVFELALATFGVVWLRRPHRLAAAAPLLGAGAWVRVLGLWLRLGAVLLPIGVIAAVTGFVMFAEAVLRLYIGGSYLAGILMLAAQLAEELTRVWLDSGALDFLYMIRRNRERVLAVLRRGYRIAAAVTWLVIALHSQGVLTAVVKALDDVLAWQFGYGDLQITVGGVVVFGITLWVGLLAGRLVFFVLEQEIFARLGLPRGVPFALATLSQYAVTTITFLLALSTLGVALEKVSILMGALGVGIGFGLQNAVSNFISGLMLLFERPIHVGDRLQLEDVTGVVTRIGMRASRLRTIEGADVIVPNSELISTRVTNWTLGDRMRMVTVPIGVAYGSDLRRTLEVLGEVAKAQPDVHAFPAPEAIFAGFGESSVDFQVRVFADADAFAAVRTRLGLAIAEALAAEGIEIPFPQRDLHLRSAEASIEMPSSPGAAARRKSGPDSET